VDFEFFLFLNFFARSSTKENTAGIKILLSFIPFDLPCNYMQRLQAT
jgi:hypothetical protein